MCLEASPSAVGGGSYRNEVIGSSAGSFWVFGAKIIYSWGFNVRRERGKKRTTLVLQKDVWILKRGGKRKEGGRCWGFRQAVRSRKETKKEKEIKQKSVVDINHVADLRLFTVGCSFDARRLNFTSRPADSVATAISHYSHYPKWRSTNVPPLSGPMEQG